MELKLLVGPDALHLVEQHPAFAGVTSKSQKATTTYYDTADLDLFRLGACLRVRQAGRSFVQTVKRESAGGPIGARGEWEWTLRSAAPDLGKLASLPDEAAAILALSDRLKPVFETVVERRCWLLTMDEDTAIEAVVDQGVIRAGGKSLPISEVELELKRGAPAAVFRLAIDLHERIATRYGSQSKSERGYGLVAVPLPDRPARTLPSWERTVSIGDVFPRLVHAALRELADEIPTASAGEVEGVHRMRAAIRKLRSLLVLFAPFVERRAARAFNLALRDLGGVLGQGRDWDVFLSETLARAEATEHGADAMLLRAPAERRREDAHATIVEAMGGRELTGLILGMGAWTADGQWLRKTKPGTPFADLVPDLLGDLLHKANKRAKKLDRGDAERLHDLRKALKKLRYSVDDVGSLFAPEAVEPYLDAIKSVLGTLGDINDAEVTEQRVDELLSAETPELAPAGAALLRLTEERRAKAAGKLPKRLAQFQAMEPFWT